MLLGKPVRIGEKGVPGVIGLKAYHLVSAEEEKTVPKLEEFYIDIGAKDKEEAESKVNLGDCAVFDSDVVAFGDGFLKAKALDDRVGCAILLELLKEELPMDVTFAFTVQEEVGTRGAFAAGVLGDARDRAGAGDHHCRRPGGRAGAQEGLFPGKGPVILYMDNGSVADRGLFERMRALAEDNHIPWQTKHYLAGGNDASAIQRTKEGVRTLVLSAAVRYLHAPSSVGAIRDFEDMLRLARLFISSLAEG